MEAWFKGWNPHWTHGTSYALLALVTFVLYRVLCGPLIADYFPTTDDIAIEAASTPIGGPVNPSAWVIDGFQDYFQPYQEWGSRPSNFFRPLFNALFWGYYEVVGTHWGDELVFGYLIHALVVGLVTYLALNVFGLTPFATTLAVAIAVFNPAMWALYPDTFEIPPALQFPSYQTEILCGALMLLAFLAFVRQRFVLFAAIATLALFLKETALTLPIAALVLPGVWLRHERSRSIRNLCLIALPLIAWLTCKLTLFTHGFSSYALAPSKPSDWLIQSIRNTLLWPTGLFTSSLKQIAPSLRQHDWSSVLSFCAELAINFAWWCAIGIAVIMALRRYGRAWLATGPEPRVVALVFAGASLLSLLLLEESHVRYGYLWFALGPAPILAALSSSRRGLILSVFLTLGLVLPQFWSIRNTLSADVLRDYRLVKEASRQLMSLLGSLPGNVETVYLLDDVAAQIPNPKYVSKFSNYPGRLVLVNSVRPVPHCLAAAQNRPERDPRYNLTYQGDATSVEYSAPKCFEPYFGLAPRHLIGPGNSVERGPWMSYSYPQLSLARRTATGDYDIGETWTVTSRDPSCAVPGACAWIGFDETRKQYFRLDDKWD